MVDFGKYLKKNPDNKLIDPILIYESLDRASDKGELRPAQEAILKSWFNESKDKNDVIVKLHTGKGKTLIGLLILQSKLNNNEGPCLYLCPNKYLVQQTCKEAKDFGIDVCTAIDELPIEFENGEKILVTTVNKLFNGITKFNKDRSYVPVHTIVLDDSHACLDIIQESFTIKIPSKSNIYSSIITLFEEALKVQGLGTYTDIQNGSYDSFLPVSYWEWENNIDQVTSILSKHSKEQYLKFCWPILKDNLKNCSCIISGAYLEITPYLLPIEKFCSFFKAEHKIYMSATVHNDSFFIKHLNVDIEDIQNPIEYNTEKWSGEKMLIIPSLIDEALDNNIIMEFFTQAVYKNKTPRFGICILTSSTKYALPWVNNGAILATKENIGELITNLKQGIFESPVVFANKYDGIDLPDASCRILIFDGVPYSERLLDRYYENCLPGTEINNTMLAQKIEQGLGRNIRGEKDYGAIVILGKELIRFLRSKNNQKYFSLQTLKQIDIGEQIVKFAREEIGKNTSLEVFKNLLNQLLLRDPNWKSFYSNEMEKIIGKKENKILEELKMQRDAESLFLNNQIDKAIKTIENFKNNNNLSNDELGWYLQQIARYQNRTSKSDSIKTQQAAHSKNNYLLKPLDGMQFKKLDSENIVQSEKIKLYYNQLSNFNELLLAANEIIENLKFGIPAARFEQSIKSLGDMLGFESERPDKQWKEGPDIIWAVAKGKYFVIECKNEVLESRTYISRYETGQMNNSCGWFQTKYQNCQATNILIIDTLNYDSGGSFNFDVYIMRKHSLEKLKNNFSKFINEFAQFNLSDLSESKINELLQLHYLSTKNFIGYLEKPKAIILNK